MTHILKMDRLAKSLPAKKADGGRRMLFQEVSGSISSGETVVVLGRSGQGKSTLLRVLSLLEQADSGSVELDGKSCADMEPRLWRRQVAYVSQTPVMLPGSVDSNLAAPSALNGLPFEREQAYALLDEAGLGSIDPGKDASELSGGEKQRLSLIRSLLLKPHFLLLDEITASLDPGSALSIEKLLSRWRSEHGTGMLWISHDQEQAARASSRIWFMAGNMILEDADTGRFFSRPATPEGLAFLGKGPSSGDPGGSGAEES